ncbi:MAG: Methylated-DNA--protein-cysteine methyltransferase [Candidatus Heimdallarchaeota archaeon LC_3]|nr:MAG: Methylated-DNA--protein-cysteine methyltransferase [Candidatus Heimdallarchaeota archaeon LC_3]
MIYYRSDNTKLGLFTYVSTDDAVVAIKLPSEDTNNFLERISRLESDLIEKKNHSILELVSKEIHSYLIGDLKVFTVPIDFSYFSDSEFQINVWKEILKVLYGKKITYKDISTALGTKGYQAVGSATGSNPIPIIVGCHRVLASDGLGGFSGGIELKKKLLEIENPTKIKKISDFY